jgi:hypothetical protein
MNSRSVIAGHSRSKNGVASLAYVPAVPTRRARCVPQRDARVKPAHDIAQMAGGCAQQITPTTMSSPRRRGPSAASTERAIARLIGLSLLSKTSLGPRLRGGDAARFAR